MNVSEANPRIFARIIDADREHVADIPRDTVLARSYVCSLCRVSVHPADKFCRSCGASFVNGGSYGT